MIFGMLRNLSFIRDERASVATIFGLAMVPVSLMTGAAIEYSRAVTAASTTQAALDGAVLSAMSQPLGSRAAAAAALFAANLGNATFTVSSQNFSESDAGAVAGTATIAVPTRLMSSFAPSLNLTRSATAAQGVATTTSTSSATDNSCILTLGEQLTVSYDVMTFNGSPAVNLTGCSLRSNKSIDCNGHSTGADTYAVGSIVGCSNPHSGQAVVPDTYATLASNITKVCGANAGGYFWTANGAAPAAIASTIIPVSRSGYAEIHVCGNLTLDGTAGATLTGSSPASDTVVVVENGGIIMNGGASVVASQVTFVLAGGSGSPIVSWPSGNGTSAASVTLSSSTGASNPWQGIAIYENPSLNVDMTWKSGTSFTLDGVLYFPNASFTVSGQVLAGPTGCSKIVVGEFTLNGSVNLKQSSAACATLGVSQYTATVATTTTTAGVAYLSR